MKRENNILNYQFEDAVGMVWATVIGNAVLALLLYIAAPEWPVRAYYPLFTALVFLTTCLAYDWRSGLANGLFLFFYLGIAAYEFHRLGVPGDSLSSGSIYENPKGVLFVFVVAATPFVYVALRLALVVPLVMVWWRGRRLKG